MPQVTPYRGYEGEVFSHDRTQKVYTGRLAGIVDVITFEGRNASELEAAFRESVDEYLSDCEEQGETPQPSFSGRFVVRIPPELHRKATAAAEAASGSLNAWVRSAIESALTAPGIAKVSTDQLGQAFSRALREVAGTSSGRTLVIDGSGSESTIPPLKVGTPKRGKQTGKARPKRRNALA
jgi:predicted HicB family RNase H-like nuclease